MNRFVTSALCALSLSAVSFAARADDGGTTAPAAAAAAAPAAAAPAVGEHKWAHLSAAHDDLNQAKADLVKAEDEHKDKGTLGGHGAKAVEHVEAAIKHIGEAAAFADSHPGKAGKHPGKVTAKEKHHKLKDDDKYPNLGAARVALESAEFQIAEGRQYHKPIGGLGGHAEKADHEIKKAIHELNEAEKFADKHHPKNK